MTKEEYRKYIEILELKPSASLIEIEKQYRYLRKLYSSSDSTILSPISGEFTEEDRKKILIDIEEAYRKLVEFFKAKDQYQQRVEKHPPKNSGSEEGDVQNLPFHELVQKQIGSILKAKNLMRSFNRRPVVKGVDIEIRSGEIIALLGRNGAGKTTTFQMMVGLVKPDSGSIYLDEQDISRYSTNQRADEGITYLPQESSVFLKTTVEKNIKMILQIQKHTRSERREITARLLEELGLTSLRRQSALSLSGGERRRLEICRALVLKPKFLLLDEPFTGIDPLTIIELQKILLSLKRKGIGIILSDHNVRDTLKIADTAYIIDEGTILAKGTPRKIAVDESAKQRFLGKTFKLGDEIESYSS